MRSGFCQLPSQHTHSTVDTVMLVCESSLAFWICNLNLGALAL